MSIQKGQAVQWLETMTSSHSVLARSTVLGVLLLLAVAPVSAASDPAIQLRQLIKSSSELHTSFGDSEVNGVSQLRAEASATITNLDMR